MAKTPKRTIQRDSVFRRTAIEADPALPAAKETPATRQTAVWLSDEEVNWLDDQCQEIKRGGWRGITRSALIRLLIRSSMEHGVELGGVEDEQAILARLGTR